MNAKEWFKLTAKTLDLQKQYYTARKAGKIDDAREAAAAAIEYEDKAVAEIVRVAMLDEEIHQFVEAECPWILARVKTYEMIKGINEKQL